MPFRYFGTKRGLAKFYPEPRYKTVIEPFCGAAGYAVYWAKQGKVEHAILRDINPGLIKLWHRLQKMTVKQLYAIPDPIKGQKTTEPLIASASGEQGISVLVGKTRQITDRMVDDWPKIRKNIEEALPLIRDWDVRLGSYEDLSNNTATWFIDPPYTNKLGNSGELTAGGYSYEKCSGLISSINYTDLANWSKKRRGQVIVCEAAPADWLPFQPFKIRRNSIGAGSGLSSTRIEMVWIK